MLSAAASGVYPMMSWAAKEQNADPLPWGGCQSREKWSLASHLHR